MLAWRAGGIEVKFPANLDACRPEQAVLDSAVVKLNNIAGSSRRERRQLVAVPGSLKLVYLKAADARSLEKYEGDAQYSQKQLFAAHADQYRTTDAVAPTAPLPTQTPAPEVTTQPKAAQKTVPVTPKRETSTAAPVTTPRVTQPPQTDGAGNIVETTSTITTATDTTTTTKTLDRSDPEALAKWLEAIENGATKKPEAGDASDLKNSNSAAAAKTKVPVKGSTIAVVVVVLVLLIGVGGFVIYCMKKRLDHVASDPNYVKGGGGSAFGNPAYEGANIDEANEGYLDIQEAARKANKKPAAKKGGLVRQESLC
jgi:hypothetical protein